ncbi:hypothetical protein N8E89_18725 (plasmid) [Phyllobacterium sp. A18/5-2]|uniref:hypothetical protein n=1 Tax=Phyllobacterium sp. A18/5-2 TaxID=2978392 RepID=UPI0021C8834D|nr:hypothetical protein [Phyllobacterium sp. A18/5-2]UXN66662.1 hypothetical protein N8E89_18725 [Phyllobacterium sp. A18/5-2]
MIKCRHHSDDVVRDGIASLAEPLDLSNAWMPHTEQSSNFGRDGALIETVPITDPIASGHMQ